MQGMEEVSFQMIAAIGEAKTLIMSAITLASNREYKKAKDSLKQAKEKFVVAHLAHFELIQHEANGEKIELGLLLIHAEDQLMTTSLLHEVAEQMITMYQKMYQLFEERE
ncbi:PTS lactose/cellobiose transporter subunit IIA [Listeria monocytogenes]|uniref:PTS lactose/cellobiose transporter subunit IIA n=1 Tax=Listeria TaxID=1637 RepID=UPI000E771D9E|nr:MULTISPECIES: PTS lactose/cellobiose transporter subunit IIA [Listeria]EAF4531683.1 PTS lactose/cellobiose transporter subunit IIA [Listeria monocytogenes serotype 1/2a]EDH3594593.1 PTS lactose/cellobiose transporter subunit IIA [Listeria monocytogenes]EKZ4847819.1 PTS lactose/cellobiose transporter subunit IIA [Listeria monocytogenes]MBC1385502.1 PTS lactose/cellobiose transporter subunit IIA [Listeria innocua]RJZ11800.1 Lichenan-specific phosphotransferase enzyme IIA component [Listeria m